jgi:hypothetical protein
MKRILFIAAFTTLCTIGSFAQQKSIVGKWKLVTLSSPDINYDVENPEQLRKDFIKQFEAAGTKADSAMIEMLVNSIVESLGSLTFNFSANGKLIMSGSRDGKSKNEEEQYTVDYDKGTIVSKSGKSVQHLKFKFDKEHLVLTIVEENNKEATLTLKRIP